MKPVIIIPRGLISPKHIDQLSKNDFCVVEAKDPSKVRFLDPIPSAQQRTKIEQAAIQLSRILLNGQWSGNPPNCRSDFARFFVELLVSGTPLDPRGGIEEQREQAYNRELLYETQRLARADAKAERDKKKAEAATNKPAPTP